MARSKSVEPKERIVQRSIGFNFRQIEFFNDYPEFKPDKFCREAIDKQIELVDKAFLNKTKNEKSNT